MKRLIFLFILILGLSNPVLAANIAAYLVYDSQAELNSAGMTEVSQSFTGNGYRIETVTLKMSKGGSPTGNATVAIYAHSGTFGTSSVPTGSALATANVLDVTALTTSPTDKVFTFASPYTTTNAVKYCVVASYSGGDESNYVEVAYDGTTAAHEGNAAVNSGGWNAYDFIDVYFSVDGSAVGGGTNLTVDGTKAAQVNGTGYSAVDGTAKP